MVCKKCKGPPTWRFVVELPNYAANTWSCETDKDEVRADFDAWHKQRCDKLGLAHLYQPSTAEAFLETKKTPS